MGNLQLIGEDQNTDSRYILARQLRNNETDRASSNHLAVFLTNTRVKMFKVIIPRFPSEAVLLLLFFNLKLFKKRGSKNSSLIVLGFNWFQFEIIHMPGKLFRALQHHTFLKVRAQSSLRKKILPQ